jgi:hypothetical protein
MNFITREDFCSSYPNTIEILEEAERNAKFVASIIMIPSNVHSMTKAYQMLKTSNKFKWKLFGGCTIMFKKKDEAMLFKLQIE